MLRLPQIALSASEWDFFLLEDYAELEEAASLEALEELDELSAATKTVGARAPTKLKAKAADRSSFFIQWPPLHVDNLIISYWES